MANEFFTSAAYAKIVKQAWDDPKYKAKLVAEPAAALASAGVELPAGVTVQLVEDTDKVIHFVLPLRPGANDLEDTALDLVAGGGRNACLNFGVSSAMGNGVSKWPPTPTNMKA